MPSENPELTPDDENRLLPLAPERMDPATRAAVRQAIATGRYREALTVLRRIIQDEALAPRGHL